MEKEDNKKYIITVRCKDARLNHISHGSVKRKCMMCGGEVWVGLALQKEKVDGEICEVCFEEFKDEFKDMEYVIKSEVIEEFIKFLKHDKLIINSKYN